MYLIYAAGGIVTAVGVALILGFRPTASKKRQNSSTKNTAVRKPVAGPSYRAVSIHRDHVACDAAKKLVDERFLVGQTPMLPLDECDKTECNCRYTHHDDRRESTRDRRSIKDSTAPEAEHRHSGSRRRTDLKQL